MPVYQKLPQLLRYIFKGPYKEKGQRKAQYKIQINIEIRNAEITENNHRNTLKNIKSEKVLTAPSEYFIME